MDDKKYQPQDRLPVVVDDGITVDELIARVSKARGRPMRVVELPELAADGASLCGLWLATDTEDIVLHAPSESALHREQFILHELAHMILQHDRVAGPFGKVDLIPDVDPKRVRSVLARGKVSSVYETAAETLADELAMKMRRRGRSRFFEVFG